MTGIISSIKESSFFKSGFIDKRLIKKRLTGLALGQLLSVMIAGTGIFSQLLVKKYGVNIPTTQSLLNYILLCVYLLVLVKRGVLWETIKTKSIYFAPLALVDLEANYIVVKAYQYTTITSVMLLDCFTIPCVVVLSRIFLKTRFTFVHIIAVLIALAGMAILVVSDIIEGESANGGSNPLLGDFLCLASSVCYAISNVGQEATVKKYDRVTYLAMIGLYGSIFCGIQIAILERNELATMAWSGGVVGYIVGFALCLFIMYSFTPTMMEIAGATVMNLSLLTSDMFGIIVAIFVFDRDLSWLYFLSFFVIVSALVIYNLSAPHVKSSEVQNLINNDNSNNNNISNYNNGSLNDSSNNNNNSNNNSSDLTNSSTNLILDNGDEITPGGADILSSTVDEITTSGESEENLNGLENNENNV
ncbi:hypothetical protein DDB_G0287003 [Dictyostelium discoideum AX4]|uniref:Solute carrier family 35 member F2 n=1 Tax=Dictyostelium discoideum TaxID=44689 RepID=Q54KZ9_DICDI|nr:hypothetical protein DDB_G0287003 [Dictyostelium discoideum AX4]EAL63928.1 hypothetical protein DDB_G0287003 [Dictyostelium discoideum AX4]|eukprot:XP_637433.1 hypothetical protein DDB_G0287003 [Dictyostelium discoideum AX4]